MSDRIAETPAFVPPSDAPPGRRKAYRAKLQTVGDVSRELGRLYREARSGTIDTASASRLGNLLAVMARILADSDLEARIDALEAGTAR